MGKYTGCHCIICQKPFADTDDIVVCPECGTPYHRSCYEASGKCVNTSLHAVGGSWQSVQDEHRLRLGGKTCPHCGFVNLPDVTVCAVCQNPIEMPETMEQQEETVFNLPEEGQFYFQAADPCCGMSPDTEIGGERVGDIASFVQTNTLYYIPLFRRFSKSGKKISVNIPCVLFPYFYFAHRKMWPMAILTGLIWTVCNLPGMFLTMLDTLKDEAYLSALQANYGTQVVGMFERLTSFLALHQQLFENLETPFFMISMAMRVLLCMFGNYLYFRFVLKSVKKIREISPTQPIRNAMLSAEGGTNILNVVGCCGLYFGLWIVIYMVMALAFL